MSGQTIGADNWLHLITSAMVNYVDDGGEITTGTDDNGNLLVVFSDVLPVDSRLHKKFKKLLADTLKTE